jgi:hypothetical protein
VSHTHIDGETCPWCEQEIPAEKLEEISGKIVLREREQSQAITTRLEQKYEAERIEAETAAKANIDLERRQGAAREEAARAEAKRAAETAAAEQMAAAEAVRRQLQTALHDQIALAQSVREASEKAAAAHQAQLEKERNANATSLAAAKTEAEAEAREATIRVEAQQLAEAGMADKLAASETARAGLDAALRKQVEQTEATRLDAEQKGASLQGQLTALQKAKETELAALKEEAAAEAIRIHAEATAAAELAMTEKLAKNAQAAADAAARAAEAESKFNALSEQHDAVLNEQLNAQRDILETAKTAEINAIKAKAFEDNQKQVDKLTAELRALEKKSNDELGEGTEIDLFETLKAEFAEDAIVRISKVAGGADIRHTVILRGKPCGTILYDSKNRGQFRFEHAAKLKADQISDKADHAILSTHKFPEKTRHLHIHDGIVLASPARVVAVATLIRQHVILTHTLRMSNAERESKTEALYDFISSDRCTQYLAAVDTHADELLQMQVKKKLAHDAAWKKEGILLKKIQKAKADLSTEISCIIGIADAGEPDLKEAQL